MRITYKQGVLKMSQLRKGNRALIKDMNRSLVINTIRKFGPISRTDISNRTGLGLSTITKIIDELSQNNLVFETGSASSTGGRRAILLEFNHQSGHAIGVKIMKDHLVIALTDLDSTILDTLEISFQHKEDVPHIIDLIISNTQKLLAKHQLTKENLEGLGIAVSGLIDNQKGRVVRSSLLNWEDVNLSEPIQQALETPVFIDNDVNAYTYAEIEKGYGVTHENFICLSIGDGIGASLVINRKLYSGEFGGAGEFGHTVIQIDGRPCHCGQHGCLEMYASNKAFELEASNFIEQYPNTSLDLESMQFDHVLEAAQQDDQLARKLFERQGDYLGVGLLNAINSFNPGTIVLIGEGMVAKDFFLPNAMERAKKNFFNFANCDTEIVASSLGNDAWVKGAALLAIDQLFQPPIYETTVSLLS